MGFFVYMQMSSWFLVKAHNLASLSRKVSAILAVGLLQAVPGIVLLAPPVSETIIEAVLALRGE